MVSASNTILLDLDGPTAQYMKGFQGYLRSIGHSAGWKPSPTAYNLSPEWFSSREEFQELHARAVEDGLFARLDVVPGAVSHLNALHDAGFYIHVVTDRLITGQDELEKETTLEFLENNRIIFDKITFTGEKAGIEGKWAIDDKPENVKSFAESGKEALLWDMSYNRNVTHGKRVSTWGAIYHSIYWGSRARPAQELLVKPSV